MYYVQGINVWIMVILQVFYTTSSQLNLSSEPRTLRLHPGDDVNLPCTIMGQGFSVLGNPIIWYKLVDSKQYQLNTMAVISEPFSLTGRYSITANMTTGEIFTVQLPLHIQGITVADNGTYRCELRSVHGLISHVTYNVEVIDKIQSLELQTNRSVLSEDETPSFTFNENEASYLRCRATGGYPAPYIRMYRDDVDITAYFSQSISFSRTGGSGLHVTRYVVDATSNKFITTEAHEGSTIRCVARNTDKHHLATEAKIHVLFGPKFVNCSRSVYIYQRASSYTMSCDIRSRPAISSDDVSWAADNGPQYLTEDGDMPGYTVNIQRLDDAEALRVQLIVDDDTINNNTSTIYTLTTANYVATKSVNIQLINAIPENTSNPSSLKVQLIKKLMEPTVLPPSSTSVTTSPSVPASTQHIQRKHKHHKSHKPTTEQSTSTTHMPTTTITATTHRTHKKNRHRIKPTRKPHHKHRGRTTKTTTSSLPTTVMMSISSANSGVKFSQHTSTVTSPLMTPITPVLKTYKAVESREENSVKRKDNIVVIEITKKGYTSGSKPVTEFKQHSDSLGYSNCASWTVLCVALLLLNI